MIMARLCQGGTLRHDYYPFEMQCEDYHQSQPQQTGFKNPGQVIACITRCFQAKAIALKENIFP